MQKERKPELSNRVGLYLLLLKMMHMADRHDPVKRIRILLNFHLLLSKLFLVLSKTLTSTIPNCT